MITDDELAAEALAADPDALLADDAVPFGVATPALVADWYMPAPASGRLVHGWRRRVALSLVATFLVIEAYGLCSTYG